MKAKKSKTQNPRIQSTNQTKVLEVHRCRGTQRTGRWVNKQQETQSKRITKTQVRHIRATQAILKEGNTSETHRNTRGSRTFTIKQETLQTHEDGQEANEKL